MTRYGGHTVPPYLLTERERLATFDPLYLRGANPLEEDDGAHESHR